MKNDENSKDPMKKVVISKGQYIYSYQLKFISNLISDVSIPASYYKKSIISYTLYNFLNDYLMTVDPKAGFFFWDSDEEEFNFQTEDDALCEAIETAGYIDVWDDFN